jgi:hypothetical protein
LLENKIAALQLQLSKKPKVIKVETVQRLETIIEPGDLRSQIDSLEKRLAEMNQTIKTQAELLGIIETLRGKESQEILKGLQEELINKNSTISKL